MKLERGDQVIHARYGAGTALAEWGSWAYCNSCYAEHSVNATKCPECGNPIDYPHQVSGKGVFDIQFKDKTHSINQKWLRKL